MSGKADLRDAKPLYPWYVLGSSFLILFFNSGARFSFGVMFKPMIAEFGWDRGAISLVFFLNMTLYALSVTVAGRFYDRYGPKWVIIISTLLLSAGYMLNSVTRSLWQFFLFYGIIAGAGLGGPSVNLMAAVASKWFRKWRGAAISLALSGNSIGQFALIPLFTVFVAHLGWRLSYLYIGLIMLVVNITLAILVVKGDPESIGQRPYGTIPRDKGTRRDSFIPPGEILPDLNLGEAMRSSSFWLFVIAMFICGSGDFLVTTHLIPLVTDHGFSPIRAGHMQAWLGLMSLAGMMVAGPVSDLIGNKVPIALTFLLRFVLFLLIVKYQSLLSFYVFALAFGFTLLVTAPLNVTLIGRLYGYSHLGLLTGFVTTIHHLGGGFWAYMGGVLFDRTGSYRLVFILSAVMAVVAFFATALIGERRQVIHRL